MKVYMISDTHFGVYLNDVNKWLKMMVSTFDDFIIPFLEKNVKEGDILIHCGDVFDNRTSIPINVMNVVERILVDISRILPVHILIGNHDNFNKDSSNGINSVRVFSYIDNVVVYQDPNTINLFDKKLVLIPWVEKRLDLIDSIKDNPGDYLFCHSDLNGCRMHLSSVAHRNADKIDVFEFKGYNHVFSGHIHIRQTNKNFTFVGSPYQMDRNDMGDQKGITILDVISGEIEFVPNTYSPVFKRVSVTTDVDIEMLEQYKTSKDYIDLMISNNLLVNNRKLRRKLEIILEHGGFASVGYIDDMKHTEEEVEEEILDEEGIDVSMDLDYEEFIRKFIENKPYEDKFQEGVLVEYDGIIKIYQDNYRSKSDN